jgi:hypothetical protein
MKIILRKNSGFISFALVFGCIILALFGLGAQGIYTAIKSRKPVMLACDDYARMKPTAKWLVLTNCVIDLTDSSYVTLHHKRAPSSAGLVSELYIPVRSASAASNDGPASIVLKTRDPEMMKTMREFEALSSREAAEEWIAKNHGRLRMRRDVQGLVQYGVDIDSKTRSKLVRVQEDLAPDFIIIEDGKRPELKQSVGYVALAGVLLVVGIVFVKRAGTEEDAANTY